MQFVTYFTEDIREALEISQGKTSPKSGLSEMALSSLCQLRRLSEGVDLLVSAWRCAV